MQTSSTIVGSAVELALVVANGASNASVCHSEICVYPAPSVPVHCHACLAVHDEVRRQDKEDKATNNTHMRRATPKKAATNRKTKAKKINTAPLSSMQVTEFYFTNVVDDSGEPTSTYLCRCGTQRKMESGTGYTNLLSHVVMWHQNFITEMTCSNGNNGTLVGFIDDKTFKILSWIDMVLSCSLPFSFCESKAAEDYVKIGSISTDSLVSYMELLTREVEVVVSNLLPKKFGIIFDGWTFRSEHFVAVFASFLHDNKVENVLITMAPIVDDDVTDHSAKSHVAYSIMCSHSSGSATLASPTSLVTTALSTVLLLTYLASR